MAITGSEGPVGDFPPLLLRHEVCTETPEKRRRRRRTLEHESERLEEGGH